MVIIVAPEDDLHALILRHRITSKGGSAFLWNATWFPWRNAISWSPDDHAEISGYEAPVVTKDDVIWWRRYSGPTVDPAISDPTVRQFCAAEGREALRGLILGLPHVVN